MDGYLGYKEDPFLQASHQLKIGVNGAKYLETNPEVTVKSLIYAWQQMQNYHKLLRWSWVSWFFMIFMFGFTAMF